MLVKNDQSLENQEAPDPRMGWEDDGVTSLSLRSLSWWSRGRPWSRRRAVTDNHWTPPLRGGFWYRGRLPLKGFSHRPSLKITQRPKQAGWAAGWRLKTPNRGGHLVGRPRPSDSPVFRIEKKLLIPDRKTVSKTRSLCVTCSLYEKYTSFLVQETFFVLLK